MSVTNPTTSTEARLCMPQYVLSNMPGLLNSLRSPSSPKLFQKLLSARNSQPPEKPQLSRRETDSLIDCIASTRTQILELERCVESLQDDTLTVCRSIQHKQPGFTPPIAIHLPEIFQGAVVLSPAEASPKTRLQEWSSIPLLHTHNPPSNDKLDIPATLNNYATDVPQAERELPSPTCISFEDIVLMADSESDLQLQLDLLALKKAQLEGEVMKLEVNLLFWRGLYKQVRSVYRQEEKEVARGKSHFCTWRPSTPSLLGQWSFDADSIPSEYTEGMASDTSRKFTSPRKGVLIREMIARVKATALFLLRPGRKRDYSWSDYDDLFLPESSDIRARATSSSTEREASDDPEQGYT